MITTIKQFKQINENKEPLTVSGLFTMFSEINNDKHTQNYVPFSDEEYYAEQILNLYDISEDEAMKLAKDLNEYANDLGYAKHDGSFAGDDSEEEDLYHEIDWALLKKQFDDWVNKQDKPTPEMCFNYIETEITKYKMLN